MRLIEIIATDYRRLKAIRFRPGPHVNEVVGANEAGKSTVLDAIVVALGGKKADCEIPIRRGANSAQVQLDLGDVRVRRTWTRGGASYLVVEDIDGNPRRAPQSLLDGLASSLGMDPLAFANADDKTQVAMLLRTLGIDVSDLDEKAKGLLEERREKTREAKQLRAAAASITINPKLTAIPVDLADTRQRLDEARAEVRRLELLVDQAHICQAEVAKEALKAEHEDHASYCEYEAEQLSEQLSDVAESKQLRLAEASSAIAGVQIDEDKILLDGLPIAQASSARRIKLGIELFAASNPRIRLALIRDGSLLDNAMLEEIHRIAEEKDVQILIEKVGTEAPEHFGLLIEDGEAVTKHEMPAESGRIVKPTTRELLRDAQEFF